MRVAVPIPPGKIGQPYATDLSALGGTSPYTFSTDLQTGETGFPTGLSMNSGGTITGTIESSNVPNTYTCTVLCTDSSISPLTQKVRLCLFAN